MQFRTKNLKARELESSSRDSRNRQEELTSHPPRRTRRCRSGRKSRENQLVTVFRVWQFRAPFSEQGIHYVLCSDQNRRQTIQGRQGRCDRRRENRRGS